MQNGRLVECSIKLMVYDEPITKKNRNGGESKIKAEILGCQTIISPERDEVTKLPTGKNRFFTSLPLFDVKTGEKVVSLPLSGQNIFAPRPRVEANDGVKAVAEATA